MSLRLKAKT